MWNKWKGGLFFDCKSVRVRTGEIYDLKGPEEIRDWMNGTCKDWNSRAVVEEKYKVEVLTIDVIIRPSMIKREVLDPKDWSRTNLE